MISKNCVLSRKSLEIKMLLKRLPILLFFTGLMLSSCSFLKQSDDTGDEQSVIHFDVHKKTLSNGLTILAVQNTKLPIFSYNTYYKVGGKYEGKGTTGASHLLEHMMFKGAKKYGEGEFDKLVEGNGGQNNAYTTNDVTVYYENLPSEHFEVIADLEADRMENLLLAKDSFEKERLVVLEERRMRYENSDKGKLYLEMMKAIFVGTPYGMSVIGEVEDLKSITRDEVQKYFKKYYAPNNAVIVVVGSLDPATVFEVIEKKYGQLEESKDLLSEKAEVLNKMGFEFKAKLPQDIHLVGTSPTPMFSLAFKGTKIGSQDAFVLDILSSILGDGGSSFLNEKFVLGRKPLLQNLYAANYTLQDSGVFFIGGQLNENISVKDWKKILLKELNSACDEAITARSVQKVINQFLVSILKDLDTNAGVARYLGDREVYYGSYEFYKKEFSIYESITLDSLRATCKKYLTPNESLFISIGSR